MSLVLMALAASVADYSVQVDHRGRPVEAVYTARTAVKTRTIGAHTPNRMDGQRCRWTARLIVERRIAGTPALLTPQSADRGFSGSRAGACTSDTAWVDREFTAGSREHRHRPRWFEHGRGRRGRKLPRPGR